jgi:hypothetical protein
MDRLLQFESAGGAVLVEVADDEPGIERAARVDEMVVKASASLEAAMEQVRAFANALINVRHVLAVGVVTDSLDRINLNEEGRGRTVVRLVPTRTWPALEVVAGTAVDAAARLRILSTTSVDTTG